MYNFFLRLRKFSKSHVLYAHLKNDRKIKCEPESILKVSTMMQACMLMLEVHTITEYMSPLA